VTMANDYRKKPAAALQSDLLSRVSSFLPQINAANEALLAQQEDAAGLVDINLQAVDDDDDDSSSSDSGDCSKGEDSSSSSGESSSDEDEDGGDGETGSKKDEAVSASLEPPPSKKVKAQRNPTIVMNLQLRPLDDIADLEKLTGDNCNDVDPMQGEESSLVSTSAIQRLVHPRLVVPPSKQPKGPLITEVEDQR
jgi:hypothetical protein